MYVHVSHAYMCKIKKIKKISIYAGREQDTYNRIHDRVMIMKYEFDGEET